MASSIEIGSRFEHGERLKRTWIVTELVTPPGDRIAHARMVAEADPHATKTVSVFALGDPRLFRRLAA
ncbi:MAG TPA: hypothetical protein VEH84_13320 [Alphaproteobacteria bacterium]|nr:hypothetical protein [Alphaproteobacteria bacterium]